MPIDYTDILGYFRGGPRGWNLKVFGLRRTQEAMFRNAQRVKADSGLKRAWIYIGPEMLEYVRSVTHKWTGTLAASHRLDTKIEGKNLRGLLYIAPGAINPITGIPASKYGPIEEERGGGHAFWEITYKKFKRRVGMKFMDHIYDSMETE